VRKVLVSLAISGILAATCAASLAQPAWTPLPSLSGLPGGFRGFPKHGEFMAAGVACGRRRPEWERQYRAAVASAARERATDAAEVEMVMRLVDAYAGYARRRVAADRREYCDWTANSSDLAEGDAIIAGLAQVR
jgi:hypothetical protein